MGYKRLTAENYTERSRAWCTVLWVESEKDNETLEIIKEMPSALYILHDKDVYDEGEKQGQPKKPHYHVVFLFENGRYGKAVCKSINLEPYRLELVGGMNGILKYLVHIDEPEKHRYDIDDVKGNEALKQKLKNILDKLNKSEEMRVSEVLDWIDEQERVITITMLMRYCNSVGKWTIFKSAQYSWRQVLREHNALYE